MDASPITLDASPITLTSENVIADAGNAGSSSPIELR
jgi:hypothetical protein